MDASYLTQIITFLTLVGSVVYQIYRENRQRKWDNEDKKEIAVQLAITNKTVDKIHILTNSSMTIQKRALAEVTAAKAAITKDQKDIDAADLAMKDYLENVKTQSELGRAEQPNPVV